MNMSFPNHNFIEVKRGKNRGSIYIDVSKIKTLQKMRYNDKDIGIEIDGESGATGYYSKDEKIMRDEQFEKIVSAIGNLNNDKYTKGGNMKKIKEWFDSHSDTLITVAVIVLLDHFLFNGSLRGRLKELMNGLLTKCEKQLENK